MADVLTLGGIAFDDFSTPTNMGAGGDQAMVVRKLPGGARVIEALEGALDLGQGALDKEREVLADHGNMSAPTVLFVLDRVLAGVAREKEKAPERLMMCALGPGFTTSLVSLAA